MQHHLPVDTRPIAIGDQCLQRSQAINLSEVSDRATLFEIVGIEVLVKNPITGRVDRVSRDNLIKVVQPR